MNRRIAYVRFCYWLGATLDLVSGVLYLYPSLIIKQLEIDPNLLNAGTRLPLGHAASLMFGWTALLLWADRNPIERRGVLLLTVFPVIAGLMLTGIYTVHIGLVPIDKMIGPLVFQTILIVIFGSGYLVGKG